MSTSFTDRASPDRVFVRRAFIVLALAGLVAAAWVLADILLLLFGAVLIAVLLRAIASPLVRKVGLPEH